jgi:GT2 family glycosyltransferase
MQEPRPQEIIVVGRAEDLDAQEVVRKLAQTPGAVSIRWLEVDRPGHIAPIEVGLRATKTPLVAFLDDDAEPEAGWLEALVSAFSDPQVACVGGRVITPGFRGKVRADAGRVRWYGNHIGNIGALEARGPVEVDGVMECNWAWRSNALRSLRLDPIFEDGDAVYLDGGRLRWYGRHIGNIGAFEAPGPVDVDGVMEGNWAWRVAVLRRLDFDPVFDFDDASMYGLDLCLRAKALGYRVLYQPAARIVHHIAPRDPALARQDRPLRTFAYSRNYTYLALKHLRGWRRATFVLWWWLVGERGSYGIATAAMDLAMQGRKIWPLVNASLSGKWAGVKVWARNGR